VIVLTPSPMASPSDTPLPSDTPVPSPSREARIAESPSPAPSPTAPPAAPAVPSTACTGSADNHAFWATVAAKMAWDVYCPVLPSGWYVGDGTYDLSAGGMVQMMLKGPGGATLSMSEGAFCTGDAATCSPHSTVLGSASFGDLPGSLDTLADGSLALYINPGTRVGYMLTETGLSQAGFVSIAANLAKVAKS
jgi:hypothetical protein